MADRGGLKMKMMLAMALALSLGSIAILARAASRSGVAPRQPVFLAAGVSLWIAEVKRPHTATSDLVPLPVTLINHGASAILVKYRDFSLTDSAGQRSMALLPAELLFENASSPLLPEGAIARGQRSSGSLYFHLPATFARPIGLRVDLEAPDGTALGQAIVPL